MNRGAPRYFCVAFLVFLGAHLFLICNLRVYPFVDLPNHLSAATIYPYYGEPDNEFSKYYSLDLFPKSNVVHILFCGSRLFPSVEAANKVYYAAYILLFPLSVLMLIRRFNGNPWFSLLSFLLLYNFSVSWGLAEYTMSMPFVLLTFSVALDSLENERMQSRIILSVLLLLLFFMHAQAAVYALLIYTIWCLTKYRTDIGKTLKNYIVALPLILMMGFWWLRETSNYQGPGTVNYISDYYRYGYIPGLLTRIKYLLTNDNTFLFAGKIGSLTALFFFAGIVSFPVWRLIARGSIQRERTEESNLYATGLAVGTLLLFLLLPESLPEHAFIYHRFSVYFLVSMILVGSVVFRGGGEGKTVAMVCILCAIHLALYTNYFLEFKEENTHFTESIFPEPGKGEKLGGLIYKYRFRGGPVYIHFHNYHIIWKKGIASTAIIDYRFGTVRRKETDDPIPPYLKLDFVGINNNYDGRYSTIDYIMIRGNVPEDALKYLGGFTVRNHVGDWTLYGKVRGAAAHGYQYGAPPSFPRL